MYLVEHLKKMITFNRGFVLGQLYLKSFILVAVIMILSINALGQSKALPKGNCESPKSETDLRHCEFAWKDLGKVDLHACNFDGMILKGIKAAGSNFSGASFNKADMRWSDFRNSNFNRTQMRKANLFHTNFDEAVLDHADMSGAFMFGTTMHHSSARFSIFLKAFMKDFNGSNSDFTGAQFSGNNMLKAYLINSIFLDANFTGTNLTGAAFEESNVSGAIFKNANLRGASLLDVIFKGADFLNADLRDVEMETEDYQSIKLAQNIPKSLK